MKWNDNITRPKRTRRKKWPPSEAGGAEKLAVEEPDKQADLAAWTVVGNVLLNLDEVLNK